MRRQDVDPGHDLRWSLRFTSEDGLKQCMQRLDNTHETLQQREQALRRRYRKEEGEHKRRQQQTSEG